MLCFVPARDRLCSQLAESSLESRVLSPAKGQEVAHGWWQVLGRPESAGSAERSVDGRRSGWHRDRTPAFPCGGAHAKEEWIVMY
jgi:hypothetical protein